MADDIRIDFDTLEQHEARLENVRSDIALAEDAIDSIHLTGGAFGLMCAFMIPPIALAQTAATGMLGSAADFTRRSAEGVAAMRETFEDNEQSVIREIEALESDLEALG